MDIIGGDVVGSLSSALFARLDPGDEATGVRLRPGAFTALYGVPADELADMRVPLADIVRPRSLLDAVRDADRPDPLAAAALLQPDIKRLSRDSGYSERHLRRRLVATTGHNPRKLARIGRMQALLAAGRGESWARTAAEFGFYDESHMINDIRALTGATPQRSADASAVRRERSGVGTSLWAHEGDDPSQGDPAPSSEPSRPPRRCSRPRRWTPSWRCSAPPATRA